MKVAVVTGTSYGLGKSIAEVLLADGFKVYGVSRTKSPIENNSFVWLKADLKEEAGIDLVAKSIKEVRVDLLVNNAGAAFLIPALEYSEENFEKMFSLNFSAPIKLTSMLRPKLKDGLVINISSDSDRFAQVGYGLYCASKAALDIYFDTIAVENKSLKVFNLLPDYIETPLAHTLMDDGHDPDFSWEINMQPQEVADCISYLVNNAAEIPNCSRIIVVNDELMESTKDPEKLYYYNVDTKEFKKLK